MICGAGSVYEEYRSNPRSICQIMQTVRLPAGNMIYSPYRSYLKYLEYRVGIDDLPDVRSYVQSCSRATRFQGRYREQWHCAAGTIGSPPLTVTPLATAKSIPYCFQVVLTQNVGRVLSTVTGISPFSTTNQTQSTRKKQVICAY